jgi:ABC-2 type transport system ATP-binding protein
MNVIETENLTKDFQVGFWRKRPVRALDKLCLQVRQGEIFGFLGPNGAGKTTTLKLLMDLIRPTSGSARILGEPTSSVHMHSRIGYLPENPYFYDYLTPEELLTYVGSLFNLRGKSLEGRVAALLNRVGLAEAGKTQLRKFSKGMIQRLGIAQAVINDPEVVFLDEPMSGLDPIGRREVREVILALKDKGVTVFFSSHILPDVEAVCDRVAIINQGKLQEAGALKEILDAGAEGHEVILAGVKPGLEDSLRNLCGEMRRMGGRLHLRVSPSGPMQELLSFVFENEMELISVSPIRPSLEDRFLQEIRKQPADAVKNR